jgi:uncharacterized protein involved in response to NO
VKPRVHPPQLFAYPFRIFFLSVGVWAVIAIPLWVAVFPHQLVSPPFALPPFAWHAHEMLFGFFAVAVAGFLMTAICNWTQTDRLHGWPLFAMWLVWALGRLTMLCGAHLPYWLVAVINLGFIPLIFFDAAKRVWLRRQSRQYPLVGVLALLWIMQLGFLITHGDMHFAFATLVLAMGVMLIIGGRITPNFSRNWLHFNRGPADKIEIWPWLEKAVAGSVLVLLVALLAGLSPAVAGFRHYHHLLALLATLAAIITFTRLALWRGWLVRKEALLWILHLSLLWIPVALLLLAAHQLGWVNQFAWIHALAVGAMAGLILGVMTRVVLGHTGRMMLLPRFMVATYVLIHVGAILRVTAELLPAFWQTGIEISATCWTLAFAIFLWRYVPMLVAPRADGRPG